MNNSNNASILYTKNNYSAIIILKGGCNYEINVCKSC